MLALSRIVKQERVYLDLQLGFCIPFFDVAPDDSPM